MVQDRNLAGSLSPCSGGRDGDHSGLATRMVPGIQPRMERPGVTL